MTLAGRTAFITGTNRGLGRAFAETFAASGANVIAHARRDTPEFRAFLKGITQKNGVAAVRDRLISALTGGSYTANYSEALGEIAKATANNPSVPGVGNDVLAALMASSGTNVSRGAMMDALQRIAGTGTLAYGNNTSSRENHQDT